MNSLFFVLFFLFLILLGRGVFVALKNWLCARDESPATVIIGVDEFALYPFFGLICLGALALTMNFIMGVANIWFVYAVLILLALNVLPFGRQQFLPDRRLAITVVAIVLALSPALYGLAQSYDAGLYHLQHQLWIREEEIVFGFAKIHARYGFSSFQEYMAAPLWLNKDFTGVGAINIAVTAALLIYIAALIYGGRTVYARIGLFLAVFGAWSMWSSDHVFFPIQNVGSVDSSAGIFLLIAFISVAVALLKKDFRPITIAVCGIFSVAAFFMKSSGVFAGILYGLYIIYGVVVLKSKGVAKQHVLALAAPVSLMFLWEMRGLIATGCLAYPMESSCLPLPWSAAMEAHSQTQWITAWARAPRTGLTSLEGWSWFGEHWWPRNGVWVKQFPIAVGVAIFFSAIAYRNGLRRIQTRDMFVAFSIFAFAAAMLVVWFVMAPDKRFASGFLAIFGVAGSILFALREPEKMRPRYSAVPSMALLLLMLISVSMIPVQSRGEFKIGAEPLPARVVEYRNRQGAYGVAPRERDQCWVRIDCYPGRHGVTIEEYFGQYKYVVKNREAKENTQ